MIAIATIRLKLASTPPSAIAGLAGGVGQPRQRQRRHRTLARAPHGDAVELR